MSAFQNWLNQLNFEKLLELLITIAAALVCITLHEVSHGYAAYRLGDPTAKNAGRLTLNPIRHIDPVGLLVMAVARFGWARAVPINPGNFKHFRRDTAITGAGWPGGQCTNYRFGVAAAQHDHRRVSSLGPAAVAAVCGSVFSVYGSPQRGPGGF